MIAVSGTTDEQLSLALELWGALDHAALSPEEVATKFDRATLVKMVRHFGVSLGAFRTKSELVAAIRAATSKKKRGRLSKAG